MATILIVDDHAVVRGGLRQFLADTEDLEITAEAATGAEAVVLVQESDWSLVLLDIALPDLSGLEVLKQIKRLRPNLPVLIFSMFSEDEFAIPSLEAGASGYLNKDSRPGHILTAIRTVISGARYVSPTLAEKLLAGVAPIGRRMPHEALSRREAEVLLMLSRGTSLTKIGESLHVSVKTVSTYRARIIEKLGLQSNAELIRYVIEHRLG